MWLLTKHQQENKAKRYCPCNAILNCCSSDCRNSSWEAVITLATRFFHVDVLDSLHFVFVLVNIVKQSKHYFIVTVVRLAFPISLQGRKSILVNYNVCLWMVPYKILPDMYMCLIFIFALWIECTALLTQGIDWLTKFHAQMSSNVMRYQLWCLKVIFVILILTVLCKIVV